VTSVDKKLEVLNKLEAAKKEYSAVCTSLNDGLEFMDKNKKKYRRILTYISIFLEKAECVRFARAVSEMKSLKT